MPLHDYHCESCKRWEVDAFWATWREVPPTMPCKCGGAMERMAGRVITWGPAAVFNEATGEIEAGQGRAEAPGHEILAGTPFEEAARSGDMVNPYLPPSHPGYYKNATGNHHREYVDLGKSRR